MEEDTKEVYHFFESVLNIEDARQYEFQQMHRIGKKSSRIMIRPVIVRFLRFRDRELVYNSAKENVGHVGGQGAHRLSKQIRERRKNQRPKLRETCLF